MCGIAGCINTKKAAELCFAELHAIQHRAQDYAGIVTSDGNNLYIQKGAGIVQDVFTQEDLDLLRGKAAVGHIRYPTVSDEVENDAENSKKEKIQPLIGAFGNREVALVHNGNLINYDELLSRIKRQRLKSAIDSELILRLFCESEATDDFERTFDAVRYARGTYSLIFLYDDVMIAVRDPYGNRPLSLGVREEGSFLSSETVAFDNLGIDFVRDIDTGEILIITKEGMRSMYFDENNLSDKPIPHRLAKCIFELIYYSHPDSRAFGESVVKFHIRSGELLAIEYPADAQMVVGVPDSAKYHAVGYSDASGLPRVDGITRSHYVRRTFIEASQWLRDIKVRRKFTVMRELVRGRKMVLIDDSVFRLTTMMAVVKLLWEAGPVEIHGRIIAPPIRHPCYYGIDVPSTAELVAANHSLDEVREMCGLTSIEFLSLEGLKSLIPDPENYCFACMDGNYPIGKP